MSNAFSPGNLLQTSRSVAEIAKLIDGKVIGDSSRLVQGLRALDEAEQGCLSFVRHMATADLLKVIQSTKATALLISDRHAEDFPVGGPSLIAVKDPAAALTKLVPLYVSSYRRAPGISERAEIDPSVKLGQRISIGAYCVIGADVEIADDVTIHPQVVIYPGVKIGARAVIHAGAVVREWCNVGADVIIQNGAVIGADGFGYVPDPELGLRHVPQVGVTQLADRVEVGANTCIDRATLGRTYVGQGSKIDNLVQIGHNVKIGQFCIVCGQVGIAGSSRVGNQVTLAGAVGVGDHVEITDGCRVGARSGVNENLTKKGDYAGFPILPANEWRRMVSALRALPRAIGKLGRAERGQKQSASSKRSRGGDNGGCGSMNC
ncbi:MAG: UDP-3-O-(3-hydroxymyristoyl)glucosamine N-acyltransferase [Deltaproteobacteria bacterium]|nr:UDP-3-O-(3-hydroxymyristoyl)glucosamine N-acyltransferase [Deltaproteobacteria bacterium]